MKLVWSDNSWSEYTQWQTKDKKILKKINTLIKEILSMVQVNQNH